MRFLFAQTVLLLLAVSAAALPMSQLESSNLKHLLEDGKKVGAVSDAAPPVPPETSAPQKREDAEHFDAARRL